MWSSLLVGVGVTRILVLPRTVTRTQAHTRSTSPTDCASIDAAIDSTVLIKAQLDDVKQATSVVPWLPLWQRLPLFWSPAHCTIELALGSPRNAASWVLHFLAFAGAQLRSRADCSNTPFLLKLSAEQSQGAATRPFTTTCIHAQTRNLMRKVMLWTERGTQTCDLIRRWGLRELACYGTTRSQKAKGGSGAHEAPMRSAKVPGSTFMNVHGRKIMLLVDVPLRSLLSASSSSSECCGKKGRTIRKVFISRQSHCRFPDDSNMARGPSSSGFEDAYLSIYMCVLICSRMCYTNDVQ
eukprot:83472-Pleurochrysis_carterae.AAC.2